MSNFKAINVDLLASILDCQAGNSVMPGREELKEKLGLTGCEVSVNRLPQGGKVPFKHFHHQNEELYIFLKGDGIAEVDGQKMPVHAGTCIKVDPAGCRWLENTGQDSLCYLCIQTRQNSLEHYTMTDGEKCD